MKENNKCMFCEQDVKDKNNNCKNKICDNCLLKMASIDNLMEAC